MNNLREIANNSLAIVKGSSVVLNSPKFPALNICAFPSQRLLFDLEDDLQSFDDDFPKWLSASDQRHLQKTNVMLNVIVSRDRTGQYRKVQEVIDAAPLSKKTW